MRSVFKILLLCTILPISATANNNFLINYFSSINKNIVNLTYMGSVFEEILHDNSKEIKPNLYGHIYKKDTPPSVNQAKRALEFLAINEYASKTYGAPSHYSRMENILGNEGFNASIFKKNNTIVIAYRGAEFGTSDWITDGISQSGKIAKQYNEALNLVDRLIKFSK